MVLSHLEMSECLPWVRPRGTDQRAALRRLSIWSGYRLSTYQKPNPVLGNCHPRLWRFAYMRKVIVDEWMTLDGVAQAPMETNEDTTGGFQHGGWHVPYADEVFQKWVVRNLSDAGGFIGDCILDTGLVFS